MQDFVFNNHELSAADQIMSQYNFASSDIWQTYDLFDHPFDYAVGHNTRLQTTTSPQQVLYLQEPNTNSAVSPMDIHQGNFGDCFLLSAIGEIAIVDPSFIQNDLIQSQGAGSETVDLYEGANGRPINSNTTSFKAADQSVTNTFVAGSVDSTTNADTYAGQNEIWPQVIEKAYAQINGSYNSIANGGYDAVAMETLTGQIAKYTSASAFSLTTFENDVAQSGTLAEFDTPNRSNLGYNLVNDHAYMFDGLSTVNGQTMVALLNPWGNDEPSLVPWTAVSKEFSGITIGHV